jgi:putative tryptophan/tyrosine transport system substrate-binding protein
VKRREFITLLGGAAATWPVAASAQQAAMPVVGWLNSGRPDLDTYLVRAFRQGLKEIGYVEGQNVTIEYRWAHGKYDRMPAMAVELVRDQVAVIVADTPGVLAAKAATTTIPIVFAIAGDPVTAGLVASMNRPGGNLTGQASLNVQMGPKRLELLHEMVPAAAVIALLVNPTNPNAATISSEARAAARILGLKLHILHASAEREFDAVFADLAQVRAGGLAISTDPFFTNQGEQLGALALRHAIPAIYQYPAFAAAGGLMSYGGSITDNFRLLGVYTGRILNGEKPADLPVPQSAKIAYMTGMGQTRSLGDVRCTTASPPRTDIRRHA